MKKFIISIIFCFIIGTCYSAPSNYHEPQVSTSASKWLAGSDQFTTPLSTDMSQGGYSSPSYHLQSGTYSNQQAIDLWMARDVWEHGAIFCQIQIQAAVPITGNANYTWIDYYWMDTWKTECAKLCEPGYSGEKCDTNDEQVVCDNDYLFKQMYSLINSNGDDAKDKRLHTEEVTVLNFKNENLNGQLHQAQHIVLGINKRLSHGAIVSPIQITTTRTIDTIGSNNSTQTSQITYGKIQSVYSNGQETLLCQEGYVANKDKTNCVKAQGCEINMDNMCDGYNKSEYQESMHKLKSRNEKQCSGSGIQICRITGTCTYFECRDGYSRESENSTKCIQCETDIAHGTSTTGACLSCPTGQYFNTTTRQCAAAQKFEKPQMEKNGNTECWSIRDRDKYKTCVIGNTGV